MRRDSMLPFVLLAVAAAPSLALPVAHSTRELATDVYERDVVDDLYARDDGALDLFERSYGEYDYSPVAHLSPPTRHRGRSLDEILSARADNNNNQQHGHAYHYYMSGGQQGQVPTHHDVEHGSSGHHSGPPPPYSNSPPPPYSPRRPPAQRPSTAPTGGSQRPSTSHGRPNSAPHGRRSFDYDWVMDLD
ncbi:hypothetical protein FOMPIDRAFT_1054093 [Fomitopsis schrenkii]|uniref:Uncharacterized protein n=1 Tax=Fomitopsis schrenkii TaxID=2126942 RepID=S8F146_FOMSC|nr:hypothetical protein FOMPIDRAFT_1054093 [Fomitopsis schrenkii]